MNRSFLSAAVVASLVIGSLASADTVTLTTGETLTGTSHGEADGKLRFTHPVLGELSIPVAQVKHVVSGVEPEQAAKVEAATATIEQAGLKVVPPEAVAEKPAKWQLFPGWDSTFEAGASGASGNSEYLNIYLKFITQRETADTKASAGTTYFLDTSDGDRSANEFRAFGRHDWLMPDSPWFWFAKGDFELDEFEAWDYRFTAHTGPGYELVKTDELKVNLIAGLGGAYEVGGPDGDQLMPEALVGGELEWKLNDTQTVTAYVTWYPDLGELPESRTVAGVAWSLMLDKANKLALKIGTDAEYESQTEGDAEHLDLKAYGALVFEF